MAKKITTDEWSLQWKATGLNS